MPTIDELNQAEKERIEALASLTRAERTERERIRLEALVPSACDPREDVKGVLLSTEIEYYATHHKMIDPLNPRNLKPAAYELSIGRIYFQAGEFFYGLCHGSPIQTITIPPFDVVVLTTAETLCLPRYIIARWNIRVRHAYDGLLWVGAPQVDPGYRGHLPCPIYNLSDKPVTLNVGDPFAVMDFVKTTPFDANWPEEDGGPKRYKLPSRLVLEDYEIREFRSALFHKMGTKLAEVDDGMRDLETRFSWFTQLSFTVFAILIALVAIVATTSDRLALGASVWGALIVGISVAALLVALFSHVEWKVGRILPERYGALMTANARITQRLLRNHWWGAIGLAVLISISAGSLAMWLSDPFFVAVTQNEFATELDVREISSEIETLRSRINSVQSELERLRAEVTVPPR